MEDTETKTPPTSTGPRRLDYPALITMMLTSFMLVTAEFLPNGMLTDIAADLGVSLGQAGQMVTITAVIGLVAALTIGIAVPRLDRRTLLLGLALAAAVSNLVVALAPNLALILLSRALLGAAISAFWSMSLTVAMRIAGPDRLGRAVMFTTAGMSLAMIMGVPLGVMLSTVADWHSAFVVLAIVSAAVALALRVLLPSVPAESAAGLPVLWSTFRMPGVTLGMVGHMLTVLGHITAYTYVRPALERVGDESTVVMLLALFGVGGLVGNLVTGAIVDRWLPQLSGLVPALIGVVVLVVVMMPGSSVAVGAAMLVWGMAFAAWLIVINAWIGRRTPGRLESGGALVVAGFQLAISAAAAIGGLAIDLVGVTWVYLIAVVAVTIGAAVFWTAGRVPPVASADDDAIAQGGAPDRRRDALVVTPEGAAEAVVGAVTETTRDVGDESAVRQQ